MVDFRPLLFLNALALMLLVTAGFASVREDQKIASAASAPLSGPQKPEPETAVTRAGTDPKPENDMPLITREAMPVPAPQAERFTIPPMPDEPTVLAVAEPPAAMPALGNEPSTPAAETTREPAQTGLLVLRSNVVGDTVTVNGEPYGATRLDLPLKPGEYEVTISKEGFKPWNETVALEAGSELTLVARLDAYTTVNYQTGTWVGGIKTGDGTYENKEGLRYEGHFTNGDFHGKGTAWYPDGSRYEGDWSQGQREGEGSWRGADGSRYSGEFRADQFNGKGTLTEANGDILTGQWKDGHLNGHGSLTTADGMLYVGGFRDDEFHGRGSLTYPDGRHYEGEFSNGAFHGTGSEIFADGKKYEGEYIEGKFHGQGLLRNPNGSSIQATFRHGEPYGQVRLTTAAGEVFTARTTEPGVCYRDKSYRATQCPRLEGW
ncbi:PEGA domain-containing protein [Marinobacter salinus]|uniref:PEGA domain-containing protein n=1 Tax=Marinobacter salinus TaxID=1874317 RepID=A0A1D9GIA6_9GAMM|nr:PEGA domain-containing protein [Marinobacter salinus]AOY87281.1 PEGA domain-containing protein [Marinobacter salinus]